jgi:aryl-alcohol dehydrogenase-like predicted oxidoreductase
MEYKTISRINISVSAITLGTWALGNDAWWGAQHDSESLSVLAKAFETGITTIDTAPIYGRGHSEELIGDFVCQAGRREKLVIASKLGLEWEGKKIRCNLARERMYREIEESRERLKTDYIDIYQVHWPDPATPIQETAETMRDFFDKKLIRAVGVSNHSLAQIQEFMRYCPLHMIQPPYNMFMRQIEDDIVPFCIEHDIAILVYAPLHSGILTGKFFDSQAAAPQGHGRKNFRDLKEPLRSINKDLVRRLGEIAAGYGKTLTQLVLNWTLRQKGITALIVGARSAAQLEENTGGADWRIGEDDMRTIETLLSQRKNAAGESS